ncbi:MAG: hypothetical protein GIKADHBN_01699 [Phycisphaerales bacterium]|nr:hypothetical protein [Phycisphaerales bacterium]
MLARPTVVATTLMAFISLANATPPTVSDLGLLPGDTQNVPATNSQQDHSAAVGADGVTLVVWSDYRARSSGSQSIQSDGDIFGVRIAPDGSQIDAVPFLISGRMGLQDTPIVAWNGENWLVMYRSQDPYEGYYRTLLHAVRVSPSGVILDPSPIVFPPHVFEPDTIGLGLAGQGGHWVVTRCLYHDDGYGTYLAGQRLSATAQIIDNTPVMLEDWVYGPTRILPCAGEYLVVGADWANSPLIKARRVSTTLQPIGSSFNIPSMTIGTSGSEFYVSWVKDYTSIVGSRMSLTGVLTNPAGTLLVSNPSMYSFSYDIAHDGSNWWFEWDISDDVWTMRISPAGNVLDPGGVKLPIEIGGSVNTAYGVTLVPRAGGGVHVMWYDLRQSLGYDTNVYSLPVSAGNVPGVEAVVSTGSTNQRSPAVALGPSGISAVSYVSEAANDDRVLVQLVGPSGQPLTTEPIEVFRGPTVGKSGIAWNGTCFMVVWDQGSSGSTPVQIAARRLDSQGAFIDAAPFTVMVGFNPDVGALGEDFLVAGARYGYYPQYIDLVAMRIDGPTAALLDGTGMFLGGNYVNGQPRVRSDGTNWLVAAHSMWTHNSSQGDAILAIVPPQGSPTPAFNPTPFSGASGDLDIAFSGAKYLLVWRMNSLSNANNYIAGRIMNADGTFQPGYFTIAEAPGRQLRPTVIWDGAEFLVAWEDQRHQSSFFDARTDVYAARVSEAGSILDPQGFAVDNGAHGRAGPALLARPGRATLAATTRFEVTPPHDSYRIGLTRIGEDLCPADFDGSGFVDTDDFDAFVVAFEAGTPDADFDGSGFVDTDDFDAFVLAFEAGC